MRYSSGRVSSGFTMVEVLIVVTVVALLATVAFPSLIRARVGANESATKANLKMIGTALETYALANGSYPPTMDTLLGQTPPYLNVNYFTGQHSGYTFSADVQAYAYTITAAPGGTSQGVKTFTVTTGSVLAETP